MKKRDYGKICIAIFCIIIEFIIVASLYDKNQALIFWPQVIFGILLHALLWFVIKQRAVLWILYIMFFAWNYEPKIKKEETQNSVAKKLPNIALFLILIITLINYPMYIDDVKNNYSSSKEVAEYIEQYLPKNSIIICPYNEGASSVFPYLKQEEYKFYSPNARRYYTYVTWDNKWRRNSTMEDIEIAIKKLKAQNKKDIYLLVTKYLRCEKDERYAQEKYEKILTADNTTHEYYSQYEDYNLYKVK